MIGEIGILNVGAGDTKITFDKNSPADTIRAARIVKDMLRRGYALIIEVPGTDGAPSYQRVHDFREDTCEYIIADLDPLAAQAADAAETAHEEGGASAERTAAPAPTEAAAPRRRGRPTKAVAASSTRGVAVARSAGG